MSAPDAPEHASRYAVLAGADRDAALAAAAGGTAVVLVGLDGGALGALAREVTDAGSRAVVFVGDPDADDSRAALAELLAELFST